MIIIPKPQRLKLYNSKIDISVIHINRGPIFAIRKLKKTIGELGIKNAPDGVTIKFVTDRALGEQEYVLDIADSIDVRHNGDAGAFYAVVTLKQILTQSENFCVPKLMIEDKPALRVRGLMPDISRNRVPKLKTLKKIVDCAADLKINQLQLYVEGMSYFYKTYAHLYQNPNHWLTENDVRALDIYCKQNCIELVANQNSFGHMTEWLAQPEFNNLAECPDGFSYKWITFSAPGTLDPSMPESVEFVDSLFKDMLEPFSSRLFNVGGDEPFELGLGRSKELVEQKGRGRVYLDFMKQIFALAKKYDKRVMLWGDVMKEHPEFIDEYPNDVIALEWGYLPGRISEDACKTFFEKGIEYYVCPGTNLWSSISGKTDNMLEVIKTAAGYAAKYGGAGLLNTDWGDGGSCQQFALTYLPYAVGAAYAWNTAEQDDDIVDYLNVVVFKDKNKVIGRLLYDLGNYYKFQHEETFAPALFRVIFSLQTDSINFGESHTDPMFKSFEQHYLSEEEYRETLKYLTEIKTRLKSCAIACAEKDDYLIEIEWSIDYLIHCCLLGIFKTNVNGRKESDLRDMVVDLERINKTYERIWKKRNKPSGYKTSSMRTRVLINKYKAILSY